MPITDHLSPYRQISQMSAPGGIKSSTSAGSGILHDQDMEDTSSTDENEFSFNAADAEEEIIINETDV